jgi:HJR/Mrr/RecB family endonuclease
VISQFYEITERKVSLLDDYGDQNWDALPTEIETLIGKIAKREGIKDDELKRWRRHHFSIPKPYKKLIDFLDASLKEHHEVERNRRSNGIDCSRMSGIEFESFLVRVLTENGFSDIRGTPATGDQGADLIAKKDGKTIIIQAKRHDAAVGNKAVQEVTAAVRFYSGDEGWVITNSSFTKSAKDLAQKAGVRLIDGRDLSRFSVP